MAKILTINNIDYYSYADLEDANIYNNAIYGSVWNSLEPIVQSQLLVEATRTIDGYTYIGEKADPEQPLKFPRISRRGVISDDSVLTALCCQVALYIYKNGSSSSGSSSGDLLNSLSKWQIGDVHVEFKDDVKIDLSGLDDIIADALAEWMKSNSMEIWL